MSNVIDFTKHLNKNTENTGPEPDEMVERQVRKLTNSIHELLNSESFNTDDPEMVHHLMFLRRCLVAMINHQYGIDDPVAELMLQGNPKQL